MNHRKIVLISTFVVLVSVLISCWLLRDNIANFIWQKYHNSEWSLVFINKDANLAMRIGDYNFNGAIGNRIYNPDIAITAYKKAVAIDPQILWGHYRLANIYFIKADFLDALSEVNKELGYNPENLRSLYLRGLIYGYSGNLDLAEKDFRRFVLWSPLEWAGYNDLSWILMKEKKYADVEITIASAMKSVSGAENNPWLWNSLGVAELNLKEYSKAHNSFTKAGELAQKLTSSDWTRAYPGNDPVIAGDGIQSFKAAIAENLKKADLEVGK